MARTLNALIYPHTPDVVAERRMIDVAAIPPNKAAWWRPVVVVGDDPFDAATHVKTGPVTTIEADRVVDAYAVRPKTVEELDAGKEAALPDVASAVFKVLFNHENRVRALEGKSNITAAQFRAALKALL